MTLRDASMPVHAKRGSGLETRLSEAFVAIERALTEVGLPGLVLGVTDRQQLRGTLVQGYSDLKAATPLNAQSRFAIGSISKSFTAIALLQLVAEGRLDLNAPITRYLPSLGLDSPFARISAHHLITHTSGLPNYLSHVASSRYLLAALGDFVPAYPPGAHWWYSNTGYQLLGYVLEAVEGEHYPVLIRRRILSRLGMTSTSAVLEDAQRGCMVVSYIRRSHDGIYQEAPWFEYTAADGSLVSSVPDMCAYARLILNRGADSVGQLLSEAAFRTLTTPVLEDYAYGLFVKREKGDTVVGHGGSIAGFNCQLEMHLEAGYALVLLSNSRVDADLMRWVADTVAASFQDSNSFVAPSPMGPCKGDVEAYAGIYHTSHGDEPPQGHALEFVVANGSLSLRERGRFRPLQRMGRDCFRLVDSDLLELPFFFGRAKLAEGERVVEVSHGRQWYISHDFPGPTDAAPSEEYRAYVGHFGNNGPEDPVARIFVRNGRLFALMSLAEEATPTLLEPIAHGLFRLGEQLHSPERVQFDTVIEGRALRMILSGTPLYRKETP